MYYSPLRYPGGKGKLEPFMELMIKKLEHQGGTYIEPFAGGAGVAIGLLINGIVSRVVINDYDKRIYSFWKAILTETEKFINKINEVPLTIDEWKRQREVTTNYASKYSFELGFATFYMNRTNRSGIIKGGVIGGLNQSGDWKLDVRFNKEDLIQRIETIAEHKGKICLYNKDIKSFIKHYLPKYEENALIYFDPPYFEKGKQLYTNYFNYDDHVQIENMIRNQVNCDWIITYDDMPEIAHIYDGHIIHRYDLNYSAACKRKTSEIIIFRNENMIPSKKEMFSTEININLREYNRDISIQEISY